MMTESATKSFKVPKIRKENKEGLREIDVNSRDAQDIKNIVQRSYIENGYKPVWGLKKIQYIHNRELEERYRQKRLEMKDEGRNVRDLGEQYTYLLFRDAVMLPIIVKDGLKCRSLPFNALGNSKLGLYLARNADIQLRLAENWGLNICIMVVFKITPGKCKVLISGSDGGEGMEPTPNYDCHVSQYQPRTCDPIHLQLARSQIYLYEYNEDCEPSDCPRHCLPYAVLTYEKGENKSTTSQTQSDSYSKRPSSIYDRSRSDKGSVDSDLQNKVEALNVTDPRLSKKDPNVQDPRTGYLKQQELEIGLCVPRLTPGPPPGSVGPVSTSVPIPSRDPRFQNSSVYQPSFGPQFEHESMDLIEQPVVPMPPEQLQLIFQPNPNLPPLNMNDPRLRRADPRLNLRLDARLDPRIRDPRLQKTISQATPSVQNTSTKTLRPQPYYSDNPNLRKKMSISDYKQKVGIQPGSKSAGSQDIMQVDKNIHDEYDPSFPTEQFYNITAENQQKNVDIDSDTSQDDLVHNPDDMNKALNELSDPEGSPTHEAMLEEVEQEDPSLAEAMRKLVEHSGDMTLITEALRKLQESAEEIGDALHDPAFLVKAIAESVESLKNAKTSEIDTNQKDQDSETSKDQSKHSYNTFMDTQITTQSDQNLIGSKPNVPSKESAMDKAMKKTLEEFHKTEQSVHQSSQTFTGQVYTKVLDSFDVSSIPIPSDPPKKIKQVEGDNHNTSNVDLANIPLPDSSSIKIKPSENSESMTNKPTLSFSPKNSNTVRAPYAFEAEEQKAETIEVQDKDERLNSKPTGPLPASMNNDMDHTKKNRDEIKSFIQQIEVVDQDYRVKEADKYLGLPIDTKLQSKISYDISQTGLEIISESESVNSLVDKDDRVDSDVNQIKDHDERVKTLQNSKYSSNLQDKDERQTFKDKSSSVEPTELKMDKDERLAISENEKENPEKDIIKAYSIFNDPSLLDKDERRSHSRSQSPPNLSAVIGKTGHVISIQNINILDTEIDLDRIRSRSASPSSVAEDTEDVKIIPLHNLDQDSQSSADSGLFDAYNLGAGKKGKDEEARLQMENEFGDVDWRLAAEAAEMGDIDLRASKSTTLKSSTSTPSLSKEDMSVTESEASNMDKPQSTHSQGSGDIDLRGSSIDLRQTDLDVRGSNSDLRQTDLDVKVSNSDLRQTDLDVKGSNIDLRKSIPETSGPDLPILESNIDLRKLKTNLIGSSTDLSESSHDKSLSDVVSSGSSVTESSSNNVSSSNQNLSMQTLPNFLPPTHFQNFHYTSNMQPMFGQPMNTMQQAASYNTNSVSLESYTTYQGPIPSYSPAVNFGGEYRSSGFPGRVYSDQYSYSTGGQPTNPFWNAGRGPEQYSSHSHMNFNQVGQPNTGGIHNIMNKVDFSNLRNILAAVQKPGPSMSRGDSQNIPGLSSDDPIRVSPDSDEERENQPAFCTGLSFLKLEKKEKLEMAMAKYAGSSSGTKENNQPADQSDMKGKGKSEENVQTPALPGLNIATGEDELASGVDQIGIIPGLTLSQTDTIPGLETSLDTPKPDKPSQDSPVVVTNTDGGDESQSNQKSDKSETKSKSPKKKSKRKRANSRNSDADDPWHDAFFQSNEQEALNNEQDDEIDEFQTYEPVKSSLETASQSESIKRSMEEDVQEIQTKKLKGDFTVIDYGDDVDSDDENGLVIDLDGSHTVKETEINDEDGATDDVVMIEDDSNGSKQSQTDREGQTKHGTDGRATPVQHENTQVDEASSDEENGQKVEVLEDELTVLPSSNNEMKKFIEKKRKNMVIKLKGETKIVDVKTGKAYNDKIVGSAIEVLGQPKKPTQYFYPTKTIVIQEPKPEQPKGSSISTLIDRKAIPNKSNRYSSQEPKEYVHPFTGQKIVYPIQMVSQTDSDVQNQLTGSEHQSTVQQEAQSIPTLGSQSSNQYTVQKVTTDPKQTNEQPERTVIVKKESKVTKERNYEFSSTSANKYIKVEMDITSQTKDNARKRTTVEKPDISDPKKLKIESNNGVTKVFTDDSASESISAENPEGTKKSEADDESELEDGEISDDDEDDDTPIKAKDQRSGHRSESRRSEERYYRRDDYSRYSHDDYSRRYDSDYGRDNYSNYSRESRSHRAGSLWSDLLQSKENDYHERVPVNKAGSSELSEEETRLLSNSAAKFLKAKQRMLAQSQVKTLGDWLKVELEIDNIEPLQNIIQYKLDTDLSIIPKPRRRKIRMKVKSAIEQEGIKQSTLTSNRYDRNSKDLDTEYNRPEVSHDQIEIELDMVKDVKRSLCRSAEVRKSSPVMLHHKPLLPGSFEEVRLESALTTIENTMLTLLGRTNYFGYPNRRVPQDLLFEEEKSSFKSVCGTMFLILMSPISLKSQKKLSLIKYTYEKLCDKKKNADDPDSIQKEIDSVLLQRQNLLRPFTGYLNKKRVNKLQEQSDHFKMVYDFFKTQVPPYSDSAIRFIKTTQADVLQHLMLSRQYIALEEKL